MIFAGTLDSGRVSMETVVIATHIAIVAGNATYKGEVVFGTLAELNQLKKEKLAARQHVSIFERIT